LNDEPNEEETRVSGRNNDVDYFILCLLQEMLLQSSNAVLNTVVIDV